MLSASAKSFTPSSFNPSVAPAPKREQFALLPFSTVEALAGCSRAETSIFLALALHADAQTGHCWPGRARLAEITRLNESRVSKATTGLERKGLIRKELIAGCRVEYYLLPQTPRPVPVPAPVPLSEPVPTPDRNGTPPLIETAPITDPGTDQKPEREPEPDPVVEVPPSPVVPPVGAPSKFVIQTRTVLADDWQLPDDYRAWAEQQRPDLADRLDAIAENFRDYHASKATRSASWIAEWRRWVNRERASKAAGQRPQATQPASRYAHLDAKETPLAEAVRAAMDISEERRLAMLRSCGIDPATGLKVAPPPSSTPTLPDGGPLPAGRNETPEEYERRFEQQRQYQVRKFQEMMEARAAKGGGG